MNLEEAIAACTIEGTVVKLPDVELDRPIYVKLQKKLEGIGGKWNRKSKGFLFSKDPSKLLGRVKEGEKINLKKQYQFFETPKEVVELMVNEIEDLMISTMLEPSAGQGALIKPINEHVDVHYCELNPDNVEIIESLNYPKVSHIGDDFMNLDITNKYDLVFANPPFTKGQYCTHIKKMHEHLNDGGRLVSIAPIGFKTASVNPQKGFADWLELVDARVVDIPPKSFKSSGTMIDTCIIVINK